MSEAISHHTAIIYAMVLVSASDAEMTDSELLTIGDVITHFPVFRDFSADRLTTVAEECAAILTDPEGLEAILGLIEEGLPDRLHETAYAAAVEVAIADDIVKQEELRVLARLRYRLDIDRLHAGAIEHAARARHMML
jgi:tellurite resistance protein